MTRPSRELKDAILGVQFQAPKTSIRNAGIQKEPVSSISKAGTRRIRIADTDQDLYCPLIQLTSKKSISKARIQKKQAASISKVGIQKKPEANVSKPEIQKKSEASSVTKAGVFCDCCLKYGHKDYKCPYRLFVKDGVKVGPRWVIVCQCCLEKNAHPGNNKNKVRKRAISLICSRCLSHRHLPEDCHLPPEPGTMGAWSAMRRKKMHG